MKQKSLLVSVLTIAMALVLALACILPFAGCSPEEEPDPQPVTYTVTVIGGSLSGGSTSGTFEEGTSVTVTATVPSGETFVEWTENGSRVSTDNPYTFTVTGNVTLTAVTKPSGDESSTLDDIIIDDGSYVRYDYTGATVSDYSASAWQKTGGTTNAANIGTNAYGIDIPADTQYAATRAAYVVANPLTNVAAEQQNAFSIVMTVRVDNIINHYESLFGFMKTANPADAGGDFFCVSGSGTGLHYNEASSLGASVYYDITSGTTFDMSDVSQYILTMTDSAIKIYLNGTLRETYNWNNTNVNTQYSRDTLQYIYSAEYFALGCADPYWGQADMLVKTVSMYTTELSQSEISDLYASFSATKELNFSSLEESIAEAEALDITNYDLSGTGATWYGNFSDTLTKAIGICYGYVYGDQSYVSTVTTLLTQLTDSNESYLKEFSLTNDLSAAFPLNSKYGGMNIVTNSTNVADQVVYMNGNNAAGSVENTTQLTTESSDRYVTYLNVEGAKLYEDSYVSDYNNDNPYADRVATSRTMGLDIPASAFNGVTAESGLTITVNFYTENQYSAFGRIFQLGDYQFETTNAGQIYYAVNANSGCEIGTGVDILTYDIVGSMLPQQWYSVSFVFDPALNTIRIYVTGYQPANGQVSIITTYLEKQLTGEQLSTLIGSIASADAENWIGRSFWDGADLSVIGAASNLSVYSRALSSMEIKLLHGTSDLTTLVTAE